jgi:hypothetical protein
VVKNKAVTYFKILFSHFFGVSEKNHEECQRGQTAFGQTIESRTAMLGCQQGHSLAMRVAVLTHTLLYGSEHGKSTLVS